MKASHRLAAGAGAEPRGAVYLAPFLAMALVSATCPSIGLPRPPTLSFPSSDALAPIPLPLQSPQETEGALRDFPTHLRASLPRLNFPGGRAWETAPTRLHNAGPDFRPPVSLILPSHLLTQDPRGFRGSSVAALSPDAEAERPAARRGTAPAAGTLADRGGGGGGRGGRRLRGARGGPRSGAGRGLGR